MENVDLMPTSHSLWTLILGSVLFLASFVMYLTLIQPIYNARSDYLSINSPTGSLQATSLNRFASATNFTISDGDLAQQRSIGSDTIFVSYTTDFGFGQNYGLHYLYFGHVDYFWPFSGAIMSFHQMVSNDGTGNVNIFNLMSPKHFSNDSALQSSSFTMICDHVTLDITIVPVANESLADAFKNGHDLRIYYSYNIDFTKMDSNVWMIVAKVLTFNSVRTGEPTMDGCLNVLVGLPCYVSLGYIIYRLVAGLIPTVSGGGGQ